MTNTATDTDKATDTSKGDAMALRHISEYIDVLMARIAGIRVKPTRQPFCYMHPVQSSKKIQENKPNL